jgi:hypothetical protein
VPVRHVAISASHEIGRIVDVVRARLVRDGRIRSGEAIRFIEEACLLAASIAPDTVQPPLKLTLGQNVRDGQSPMRQDGSRPWLPEQSSQFSTMGLRSGFAQYKVNKVLATGAWSCLESPAGSDCCRRITTPPGSGAGFPVTITIDHSSDGGRTWSGSQVDSVRCEILYHATEIVASEDASDGTWNDATVYLGWSQVPQSARQSSRTPNQLQATVSSDHGRA